MRLHIFRRAFEQLDIVESDGDSASFNHLLVMGELLTKFVVLGMCALVCDDSDRHRYALLYRLVRADSIGHWTHVFDDVLVGPTSQLLSPTAQAEKRALITRTTTGDWQYDAISLLDSILRDLDPDRPGLPAKLEGRAWFSTFVQLRNTTRGHGVLFPKFCASSSPKLRQAIELILDSFPLFQREWVYLHQNLSGKYRVTRIGLSDEAFQPLKSAAPAKWGQLLNGVYVFTDVPVKVELLFTDPDLTDYFMPNGAFRDKSFETISYLTNVKHLESNQNFLSPATQLPASATEGCSKLHVDGETFSNAPTLASGYIRRKSLEDQLFELITDRERRPIVSLIGRGGIGKTSLALEVLARVAQKEHYSAILWFSSRDIDLLPQGPKPVRPHLLDEKDMAKEFVTQLSQLVQVDGTHKPIEHFAKALTKSPLEGPILFVFDNFETASFPVQLFNWIDTYIRHPNKILITSRFREFKGDYAVDVLGMEDSEAMQLVESFGQSLGIAARITPSLKQEIVRESDGHPYIIKMLLGEFAKNGALGQVERIVASKDDILNALFDRSFAKLSSAAQLVFLTLASWRSVIPKVAVEAVLLRPVNEKLDVQSALDELQQSSFIEVLSDEQDHQDFIALPLSATIFGRKKLGTSAMKLSVEANVELLLYFGAGQRTDLQHGIGPRIEKFFRKIAANSVNDEKQLVQHRPVLEYLSRQYAPGWLLLARMLEEKYGLPKVGSEVLEVIRHFIAASTNPLQAAAGWTELVRVARTIGDTTAELQGLMELASLPNASMQLLSDAANRVNNIAKVQASQLAQDERRLLAHKLLKLAEDNIAEADATDLSRFAWLALGFQDEDRAREFVSEGLKLDPENYYCLKLAERMA